MVKKIQNIIDMIIYTLQYVFNQKVGYAYFILLSW